MYEKTDAARGELAAPSSTNGNSGQPDDNTGVAVLQPSGGRKERQIAEIKRALAILADPGQVIELRIPKVDGKKSRTDSGYFTDLDALAAAAVKYNGRAHGVYFTLNPVRPELLARAANRMEQFAELTTADHDIAGRRWLPIDIDPRRPAGISSSESEHAAAHAKAVAVREWLSAQGWPDPVVADSGNGAHLLYRIDLPNDQAATQLIQKCLQALAARFDDPAAAIDTTVYNGARIWKLYGSQAAKGDNTPERPHRWAYMMTIPAEVAPVPADLLRHLAGSVQQPAPARATQAQQPSQAFELEQFIARHAATLDPGSEKQGGGGERKWRIDCPFVADHKRDAFILQRGSGEIAAGCSHNSCAWNWHDLRERLEPRQAGGAKQTKQVGEQKAAEAQPAKSLAELIGALGAVQGKAEAQRWALSVIPDAALLPDADRLRLCVELNERKVPQGWLDREWLPAVRQRGAASAPRAETRRQADTRYRMHAGRIWESRERLDPESGEVEIEWLPLSNFAARIVADVALDDGEEVTRNIAIAGELCTGEPLPEVLIDAADFEKMTWPIESWGARVSVEPGRGSRERLRHAIQTLSGEELAARRVFTHTGWRQIDGERVFLTAAGALGRPDVSVDLPGNLASYALPDDCKVSARGAMQASLALLDVAPDTITAPLWAAMYLAPLSELITPAFTIWIEGESGSFKSSLAAVFLSHFGGRFHEFSLPASWDSTANSLEKLAFHAKDVPLLIDDFRPMNNRFEAAKMHDAASKVIRAAGNRQGRGRLDSESGFRRVFSPRGVILATAERGALGKSTNARLVTLDVAPGAIRPDRLSAAQQQRAVYGYAMAAYIRWVGERYDQLAADLRGALDQTVARQNGEGHRRLPGAVAALYVAFNVAMEYAVSVGAQSESEAAARAQRCYSALQEIAQSQAELIAEHDPALQFLQVIVTLLRARQILIEGPAGLSLGDDTPSAERVGWHDGAKVYLLSTAYNVVSRFFARQNEMFPSDEITLNKELGRKGWLADRDDEGRIKVQRRDPGQAGKRERVLCIALDRLAEVAAGMAMELGDLYVPVRSQGRSGEGIGQ